MENFKVTIGWEHYEIETNVETRPFITDEEREVAFSKLDTEVEITKIIFDQVVPKVRSMIAIFSGLDRDLEVDHDQEHNLEDSFKFKDGTKMILRVKGNK